MTDKAKAAAFDRLRAAAEENRKAVLQYDYITWLSLCDWMDLFLADAEKAG